MTTAPSISKKKVTFSPNPPKNTRSTSLAKLTTTSTKKPSSIDIDLKIDTPSLSPTIIEKETNLTNFPPNNLLTPPHNKSTNSPPLDQSTATDPCLTNNPSNSPKQLVNKTTIDPNYSTTHNTPSLQNTQMQTTSTTTKTEQLNQSTNLVDPKLNPYDKEKTPLLTTKAQDQSITLTQNSMLTQDSSSTQNPIPSDN